MILVIGGTGFVGRAVVRRLLQLGENVRVLSRNTPTTPLKMSGVTYVTANILDTQALEKNLDGVKAVINLVGIIRPTKKQNFHQAHVESVRSLIEAMNNASVRRLVHMSALGTRPYAASNYHRTKWQGEELVRQSGLDWTIMRPGLIVGPGDGFVTTFVKMMRPPISTLQLGTIPLFGGGTMLFQPVAVEEVAKCFARVISHAESVGATYEICGREQTSLREMIEQIARTLGKKHSHLSCNPELLPIFLPIAAIIKSKPLLFDVPLHAAKVLGWLFEKTLPHPPLTYDQVLMLEEGSVGDPTRAESELGLASSPFGELISYLQDA